MTLCKISYQDPGRMKEKHWFDSLQKQISFFSNPKRPKWQWEPPNPCSVGVGVLPPGVRRPRRETNHSPPSSTESMKKRNSAGSLHGVQSLAIYSGVSPASCYLCWLPTTAWSVHSNLTRSWSTYHELVLIFSVGELGVFLSFLIVLLAVDCNSSFLNTFIMPSAYLFKHNTL
jgi:hypothetical protein